MNKEKFYITTPIYYPSGNFHIGHCYATIVADSIARYKRLKGYDVFFQTGTDEHGIKIQKKAESAGVSPKEYVDKIVEDTKDLWSKLNISYNRFLRTTDKEHIECVQKIFKILYDKGDIYKGYYSGLYCTPCESFWTKTQLVDGKCPDCGREVQEVKEEAYFLKLSKYQEQLVKYYDEHPDFIQPISRKNEMINNFINEGLEDLCVSRTSFTWGIPVTFDQKHVVYVWIDALSNYISSLGYLSEDDSLFKKFWPADIHIVGKEIMRFHTIVWPIMLFALGLEQPKQIFGHGWLKVDGQKISKSFGNYKDPREYIDKYGADVVRYYSLREVPFGSDGNFSEDNLIMRLNSDLANVLGNLVQRTISMVQKYFAGKVSNKKIREDIDSDFINMISELSSKVDKQMEILNVGDAVGEIFDLLRCSNKYIDETVPWVLAKDENKKDRLETVLYNLLESIRVSSCLLTPFLPDTSDKIKNQLGNLNDSLEYIDDNSYSVNNPEILFKRVEK